MFVFPLIYITSFFASITGMLKNKIESIIIFMVLGLPIYTTALSILYMYGFGNYITPLQAFKELIILIALTTLIIHYSKKIVFHLVDVIVIAFFVYTLLYVFLPIGQYGFVEKLIAFKSLSFFVLIYFTGRLFDPAKIFINRFFYYICAVCIAGSLLLLYEVYHYQHFQTMTGYADYNYYIFNQDPSGNYGLSWTFEIESGAKRFASFFSNPLENSAATLLAISVLAGLYTQNNNRVRLNSFGWLVLAATLVSIFFSLSRASFVSYFLMIYVYAWLTHKKYILWFVHGCFISVIIYFIFFIDKDTEEFVINTLNFTNPSSLGHLIEWLDGIDSMIHSPLGVGLGASGKVSNSLGQNIGGENQFIIIGVQAGVIGLGMYIAIYWLLIRNAFKWFKKLRGKEKKVSLSILLMKIGFLVPMMTANFESYIYVSYISWFLSGLFITMIVNKTGSVTFDPKVATAAPA